MTPEPSEHRKLAAIMFTDMVGYSALTQRNEALALALVHEQQRLLRPIFTQHSGREVKGTGDGFLVEFASALQAMSCAIDMQKALVQYNASAPAERRIQVRIGLHVGDVVVRDGDVFGDGVNIAARIEPLAEAGGICISGPVFDQIRNKVDVPLVRLGQPELKNIHVPIDVYRVVLPWEHAKPSRRWRSASPKMGRRVGLVALLVTVLVVGGVSVWRYQQPAAPTTAPAPPQAAVPTPLAHGEDRRSVAVLPFVNMSADAADEYLSDGMTEEIITALSKLSGLRVAARTSSFAFKGKNEAIEKIGDQLHVHTVLEGSVRKAANRLRITTQLINIADGYHLWSETYDREMADIFAIQSEVAQRVADALKVTLLAGERQRLERKATENLDAYNSYLLGRYYWNKRTEEGFQKGIEQFEQAIEKDPNYASAYTGLADCYLLLSRFGGLPPATAMPKARAAVTRALEIDDTLAEAHNSLAMLLHLRDRDWLAAEREWKRALQLNPNYATAHHWYGIIFLSNRGRADEAIAELKRAQEIDPLSLPISADLAWVLYYARRYDQAVEQVQRTLAMDPKFARAHMLQGLRYLQQGRNAEAIAEFQAARQLDDSQQIIAQLGHAYAVSGRTSDAHKALNDLNALSKRHYVDPYWIALIYTGLGDKDRAFEWLGRAYEERSSWLTSLKVEPQLDSVRSDPRFVELLKKVGLDK